MSEPNVAIIGAGPAGAMAAFRLAAAGIAVQLIDPQIRRRGVPVETLSPEGRNTLSQTGLWSRLPSDIARPCPAIMTAWGQAEPTIQSFITHPYGYAWHVDRGRFDNWLLGEATAAGAELVTAVVRDIRRSDLWTVAVRERSGASLSITAEYLVVATGRYATVPHVGRRTLRTTLCIIGGLAAATKVADEMLVVEAVPQGWWYSVPSTPHQVFSAWVTDGTLVHRPEGWDEAMTTALAHAPLTRTRVNSCPHQVCYVSVPISEMIPCAGNNWIAVGDAALARDPLSGDGLAWALRSACAGATAIVDAIQGKQFIWRDACSRGAAAVEQYRTKRACVYAAASSRWPNELFWNSSMATRPTRDIHAQRTSLRNS